MIIRARDAVFESLDSSLKGGGREGNSIKIDKKYKLP